MVFANTTSILPFPQNPMQHHQILKIKIYSPGWVAQLVGALSHIPKGYRLNPHSGHIPRLWVQSPVGTHIGGNPQMFLSHINVPFSPLVSLPLSLPLPPSLPLSLSPSLPLPRPPPPLLFLSPHSDWHVSLHKVSPPI